jgi:hypothetical protein
VRRTGLALPDNPQYRGLVNRLPALVWERRRFTVLFVSKDAAGTTRLSESPGRRSSNQGQPVMKADLDRSAFPGERTRSS